MAECSLAASRCCRASRRYRSLGGLRQKLLHDFTGNAGESGVPTKELNRQAQTVFTGLVEGKANLNGVSLSRPGGPPRCGPAARADKGNVGGKIPCLLTRASGSSNRRGLLT